jgi:hypothetical protein
MQGNRTTMLYWHTHHFTDELWQHYCIEIFSAIICANFTYYLYHFLRYLHKPHLLTIPCSKFIESWMQLFLLLYQLMAVQKKDLNSRVARTEDASCSRHAVFSFLHILVSCSRHAFFSWHLLLWLVMGTQNVCFSSWVFYPGIWQKLTWRFTTLPNLHTFSALY